MDVVAVFGSSMVQSHQADYRDALQVGKVLAEAGYAVISGGYAGIMEAASKGAAQANGRVIGVTAGRLQAYRGSRVNGWVSEEVHFEHLRDRIMHLVVEPDAYVVMPGGLGTLNELILVWELMRVGELPSRPIVLFGAYWPDLLAPMRNMPYFKSESWALLHVVDTAQELVQLLDGLKESETDEP